MRRQPAFRVAVVASFAMMVSSCEWAGLTSSDGPASLLELSEAEQSAYLGSSLEVSGTIERGEHTTAGLPAITLRLTPVNAGDLVIPSVGSCPFPWAIYAYGVAPEGGRELRYTSEMGNDEICEHRGGSTDWRPGEVLHYRRNLDFAERLIWDGTSEEVFEIEVVFRWGGASQGGIPVQRSAPFPIGSITLD